MIDELSGCTPMERILNHRVTELESQLASAQECVKVFHAFKREIIEGLILLAATTGEQITLSKTTGNLANIEWMKSRIATAERARQAIEKVDP